MNENEIMEVEEIMDDEVITEEESWSENEEESTRFPVGKILAVVGGIAAAVAIGTKIRKKKSEGSNKPSLKDRMRYLIKGELPDDIYDEDDGVIDMEDDSEE